MMSYQEDLMGGCREGMKSFGLFQEDVQVCFNVNR